MRRSEMLSKIASVIINYNEAHCIINRDKAMEMAETILQIQEKNGMKPPLTTAKPFDFTNTGFTQEFLDEHEFKVNRWEPEDEEK